MGRTCSTYGTIQKCIQSFNVKIWEKEALRRPRRRWEENIEIDLREVRCVPGD